MKNVALVDSVIRLFSNLRPVWFKHSMLSFLFHLLSCGNRLSSLFSQLRLSVFLVSGCEKHTGETIRILFVGGKRFPIFLSDLIFSETPMMHRQGKVFIFRIKNLKIRYDDKVNAVIISCDQFYHRFLHQDGFFVFPHMVDMSLDCSKGFTELSNGFSRDAINDIKMMQKYNFSFEQTKDIEKLKIFYYDMFLETLSKRIGKRDTFTPSLIFLKGLMEIGYELMLITYNGAYVCGGFYYLDADKGLSRYSGVLGGKLNLIKKRTSAAIYYSFIQNALKRNTKKIYFGGVNPFFNDGLFRYKRKWGMKVESYDLVKLVYGLQIVTESGPLKQFLIHNPFIGMNEKNELIGFVFVDQKIFNDTMSNQLEKSFQVPGVKEVRFIKI
jgi:hypothetical protein